MKDNVWEIPGASADEQVFIKQHEPGTGYEIAISFDCGYGFTTADLGVIIAWLKKHKPEVLV